MNHEMKVCPNKTQTKVIIFSCEIEVCQNNANRIDNFSREIEVCQNKAKTSLMLVFITSNLVRNGNS